MEPSPHADMAEKVVPSDNFEHQFALGPLSTQNEYISRTSTSDLGVGWSGRLDGALSQSEPPVLDCQCIPLASQADPEPCRDTAECSLHVDQEYLSWRQICQTPITQGLLAHRPTCSLDTCSGCMSTPQVQTFNDRSSFRSFAVDPRHKEALLSNWALPGTCVLRYQDSYPKTDSWNTYGPCGTTSGLVDTALPFSTSTSKVSPAETAPSTGFSSQYLLGDSDPLENSLSLQHTSSEAACVTRHALRTPHVLSYGLIEPEKCVHKPDRPNEWYPKTSGSFSAPAPELNYLDWSSSPCLSDCLEYTPDTSSKNSARRSSKDGFLIRSKLSGMSYREIKVKGCFREAESTLRGRFRTLTKRKEQRVRKPQWQERDVSYLHRPLPLQESLMI